MTENTALPHELRELQSCPKWCLGDDHMEAATDCGDEPVHFVTAGEVVGTSLHTDITQPTRVGGGWPVVTLHGQAGGEWSAVRLRPPEARSVAAMLVRAADLIEFGA